MYSNPLANTRFIAMTALIAPLLVVLRPRTVRSMAIVAAILVVGILWAPTAGQRLPCF